MPIKGQPTGAALANDRFPLCLCFANFFTGLNAADMTNVDGTFGLIGKANRTGDALRFAELRAGLILIHWLKVAGSSRLISILIQNIRVFCMNQHKHTALCSCFKAVQERHIICIHLRALEAQEQL